MSSVNLEQLAGGALQEKFDDAMDKVLKNMMDPNTPWKNKRAITVTVTFEQNEERDDVNVAVNVTTKMAPVKGIATKMSIGKDLKTGEIYAEEYGKQIRGQMSMEDYQRQQQEAADEMTKTVDVETGEIFEAPSSNVIDLRKARQA